MDTIVQDDGREVDADWRENGEDAAYDRWTEQQMQRLLDECQAVKPQGERMAA